MEAKILAQIQELNNSLILEATNKLQAVSLKEYDARYSDIRERIELCINQIRTLSEETKNKIQARLLNQESIPLKEILKENEKKAKRIIKDQYTKARAIVKKRKAETSGAIGFIWKTRDDSKVAGRKTDVDDDSIYHGDHWNRRDKFYYYNLKDKDKFSNKATYVGDLKDGEPGMPINCRCYAHYIYTLEKVPEEFLNQDYIDYEELADYDKEYAEFDLVYAAADMELNEEDKQLLKEFEYMSPESQLEEIKALKEQPTKVLYETENFIKIRFYNDEFARLMQVYKPEYDIVLTKESYELLKQGKTEGVRQVDIDVVMEKHNEKKEEILKILEEHPFDALSENEKIKAVRLSKKISDEGNSVKLAVYETLADKKADKVKHYMILNADRYKKYRRKEIPYEIYEEVRGEKPPSWVVEKHQQQQESNKYVFAKCNFISSGRLRLEKPLELEATAKASLRLTDKEGLNYTFKVLEIKADL